MPYIDPDTIALINPGDPIPAAWTRVVRDDLEFLIDPPACSVFNSASQSVATSTTTILSADSENFDNDGMHDLSVNNSRITVQTAGRLLFMSRISFDSGGTGMRRIGFLLNGVTTVSGQPTVLNAGGGFGVGMINVAALSLAVGDFVECQAQHTQGSNLGVTLQEFAATYMTR